MEEFLEKLQEDQRRMRDYLRSQGLKFKNMGIRLAGARRSGARVFVLGEPPLDGIAQVVSEEYLTHLPALPVDLSKVLPQSVNPDESDEVPSVGREAAAKQVGRHLHEGDLVLAFLHTDRDFVTRKVLEIARARRVKVLIIGGLQAKNRNTKRLAGKLFLTLPTRGIKTVCEASFISARILARISRASFKDSPALVQVDCETCNETVFFEDKVLGRKATCPLCQARMRIPKDAGRRAGVQVVAAAPTSTSTARPRRLKPSVLEMPTLKLLESDQEETEELELEEIPSDPAAAPLHSAPMGLASREPSVEDPSFGSDIVVGSSVVSATPLDNGVPDAGLITQSADPFSLEDAFLADLEMPGGGMTATPPSAVDSQDGTQRQVSTRYTIKDCALRWGRGGFPDDSGPEHELITLSGNPLRKKGKRFPLITLSGNRLTFVLNPDDAASATLAQDDELWIRIEIPAFLEPILVRGTLKSLSGISGNGRRGTRAVLEFRDVDEPVRKKLERAAENLGAPT